MTPAAKEEHELAPRRRVSCHEDRVVPRAQISWAPALRAVAPSEANACGPHGALGAGPPAPYQIQVHKEIPEAMRRAEALAREKEALEREVAELRAALGGVIRVAVAEARRGGL